ncbi:MAG: gamma-glutamyltransferase, partial [Cyanobacteriota bacterium]|nr:gamma-glutamyltransferase [Cyanobacteriota bacterium]
MLVAGQAAGLLLAPLLWGVTPLLAAPAAPATAPDSGAAAAGPGGSAAAGHALPVQRRPLNELQERGQRFQPLRSAGGMVVSQEALASQVGATILSRGGNAVDAAVATAFALAVTLPQAGNLGGGGFLVLWLPGASPAGGRGCLAAPALAAGQSPEIRLGRGYAVAVNFRETAPAAASAAMFQRADGSVDRPLATRSLRSTGVPGSVAGMLLAQRCYGRLPRSLVLAPAIALAEKGVRVEQELADSLTAALPLLGADRTSRELFLRPLRILAGRSSAGGTSGEAAATRGSPRQGADPPPSPTEPSGSPSAAASPPAAALAVRAPQLGELLHQPQLAATLRRIALQGEAGFYRGPVAEALVQLMAERGGLISAADLRAYRAELVRPVQASFRGYPLLSMPPPGGGLSLLQLLQLLEPFDLEVSGAGSALTAHRLAEAMNLVFRDRNQ